MSLLPELDHWHLHLPLLLTLERRSVCVRFPALCFGHIYLREKLESRRFNEVRIFLLQMSDDHPWALEGVKRLEQEQLETGGFDPVHVACETRDHRYLGLLDKITYGGRFSECAACSEVDNPVREPVIHHSGEVGELYTIAMKVDTPRASVKREIEHPVIPLAEQIQVVLQLLAGIAGEVAELRFHGLRDQL